jgi:hypothetical protein
MEYWRGDIVPGTTQEDLLNEIRNNTALENIVASTYS